MKKDEDKKEEKQQEIREALKCDNCGSKFVYVLANSTIVCRRCSHRSERRK